MPDFPAHPLRAAGQPAPAAPVQLRHFVPKHVFADVWRTFGGAVVPPGAPVPGFDLDTTDGGRVSP